MSMTSRTLGRSLAERSSEIWERPRKPSATTTSTAPVRSTMSATSWPVYRELAGTSVPPAYDPASAATTQSTLLGAQSTTRPPGSRPRAR
jgi:hypothetical protein